MLLLRSKALVVVALLYTAISITCTRIPLLNYLGYEFSALIGLVGSVLSAFLTVHLVKPVYRSGSNASGENPVGAIAAFEQSLLLNMIVLVVPLIIMLTNAVFVRNCSIMQGLEFFLLIPVVSVWFGTAMGFFCAVHYRFAKSAVIVYYTSLLLYTVYEGYFTPAVYSYNFLYGYFPGVTYDEAMSVSWTLIGFRILTALVGVGVVWWTRLLLRYAQSSDSMWKKGVTLAEVLVGPAHRAATTVLIVALLAVWFFRGDLGLESTARFIQSKLGSRFVSEHFVIYYSKASYNDEQITWIGAEHEFRLKQVAEALYLPFHGRIESYIYPSAKAKERFIGTGTTNIAKPWSGQIHITKQSLETALKHELVHMVAAPFGLPVIHASLSTGLTEGVAVAIEWEWGNRTPHQFAAAMKKFGVMPDVGPLMLLTGFAAQSSEVSYVVCGSFCRFLIDRYGMRKMMQVYRSGNFDLAYGRTLHQLVSEWQGFLDRVKVLEQDRDIVDVVFRRPPIFRKVCARIVAERNKLARQKYEEKKYHEAAALYRESFSEGRGYAALSGYLSSALRSNNAAAVEATLDSIIMKAPHPTQYLPLLLTIGDACWALGNTQKALDLYTRVSQSDLSVALDEALALRSYALKEAGTDTSLRTYFLSEESDTARLVWLDSVLSRGPELWLACYLKGRLLLRMQRFGESLDILSHLDLASKDSLLEGLRLRMAGHDLFRLRKFEMAKSSFWCSLNYNSSEVAVNEVNDWIDRCEWMEKYELK